jgi:anti-sigma B factor antagonist
VQGSPGFEASHDGASPDHDGRPPAIVRVRGDIDLATRDEIRRQIEDSIDGAGRVVLDLSQVTFIDSSGLTVLVETHQRLGQNPEAFAVRAPSPPARRVLALSGLDQLMTIVDADDGEISA